MRALTWQSKGHVEVQDVPDPTIEEPTDAVVRITSTDPHDHPAILFNYLSTDQDRREWVEAIHVARKILTQPAFEPYNGGELSPGPSVSTPEEILDWVRKDAETALHPSCT